MKADSIGAWPAPGPARSPAAWSGTRV